MDDYKAIEKSIAKKYNAEAKGTKKSIGDFLLDNNDKKPVNVKSNNLGNNNYSPNIISAKRLIKWIEDPTNELYFIFVNYNKEGKEIKVVDDSGLIPVHHLSWNCLSIEAQGWGVIQMPKTLEIDSTQDVETFKKGLKKAYEHYISKEEKK